jgi:hypothetical protein
VQRIKIAYVHSQSICQRVSAFGRLKVADYAATSRCCAQELNDGTGDSARMRAEGLSRLGRLDTASWFIDGSKGGLTKTRVLVLWAKIIEFRTSGLKSGDRSSEAIAVDGFRAIRSCSAFASLAENRRAIMKTLDKIFREQHVLRHRLNRYSRPRDRFCPSLLESPKLDGCWAP